MSWRGWQCAAYAAAVFSCLWGYYFDPEDSRFDVIEKFEISRGRSSLSYDDFLEWNIRCGAYMRTTTYSTGKWNGEAGHSLIILKYDRSGITTLEGNYDGYGGIAVLNYTWENFNSYTFRYSGGYPHRYVCFISQPKEELYYEMTKDPLPLITVNIIDKADSGSYFCKEDTHKDMQICEYKAPDPNSGSTWVKIRDFLRKALNWLQSLFILAEVDDAQEIYILGSVTNRYGKWYLLANNMYVKADEFDKYFQKIENAYDVSSVILINPTCYPSGNIPKKSFSLAGTITSTCDIRTITGTIYDVTADEIASENLVYVGTTRYSIAGSSLDRSLKFNYLTARHTYYLEYKVVDITGNSEIWRSGTFTVYNSAPNVSVMPGISTGTITNGQRVNISCSDSNATIHYTVNGGQERTGTSSLEQDFTVAGSYNIDAWTTRDGYSESSHNYGTISVTQAETPAVSDVIFTNENAYVTISGSGSIYYTTDGATPSRSGSQYNGPIYLNASCTLQAISVEEGKQDSSIASKQISISVPEAPSVSLFNTKDKIAIGKAATASWQDVSMATAYDAILYYQGQYESALRDLSGTTASFALTKAGVYDIRVQAKNFLGSSLESVGVSVEAMPPVTITFVDRIMREDSVTDSIVSEMQTRINEHDGTSAEQLEGNILSVQTIDYDSTASRISAPSKKGFKFEGFSEGWSTAFTRDTTVYAEYSVLYYDVEFWNYYGEGSDVNHRIGEVQRIMYTASAVAPESGFAIPTGYKLAGWSVDNTISQCFDYTYVDGNIKLYTSYTWENMDLPAVVEIKKVTRDEKCTSYLVDLDYLNNNLSDTQARLIVSIYTTDGRMVYVQTKDIDMDQFRIGQRRSDTMQLNYSNMAGKISAVLVQVKNDRTGGAVSAMASTTSIEPDGHWTNWNEWSENPVYESATRRIESKLQYRYRTKQVTSGNQANLDGWIQYNRTSATDNWSDWSIYEVSAYENESIKREVNRRYIDPIYKTQYHYFRFYLNKWGTYTHPQSYCPYFEEIWVDYELPLDHISQGISLYAYDGRTWIKFDGSTYGGQPAISRGLVSVPPYFTREVLDRDGYWQYQYRDTRYSYDFWRWGDWSDWSDSMKESIRASPVKKGAQSQPRKKRNFSG